MFCLKIPRVQTNPPIARYLMTVTFFGFLNEVRSLSLVDSSCRNIEYSYSETIYATAGSVCHDEIVVRIGVPGPKGITAFHQIIKDKSLSWRDRVGAIAAYNLW